jgi:hypothetical protein
MNDKNKEKELKIIIDNNNNVEIAKDVTITTIPSNIINIDKKDEKK